MAGETFFKNRKSLYDILPQFWKDLQPHDRRTVVNKIDGFYASDGETWTEENIFVRENKR